MEIQSFINSLAWRYATKTFDSNKKISDKTVSDLLEATRLTASSFGLQPWKLFVVTDQTTKENLKAHSWNQPQITDCSHLIVLAAKSTMDESYVNEYVKNIAQARSIDVASVEPYRQMMLGFINNHSEAEKAEWMSKQVYIALGTLLSACAVAKIDSCPMEGFDANAYNEILNLTEKGYSAKVLCPVGIRSENDKSSHYPKVRLSTDKAIEFLK